MIMISTYKYSSEPAGMLPNFFKSCVTSIQVVERNVIYILLQKPPSNTDNKYYIVQYKFRHSTQKSLTSAIARS